MRLCAHLRTFDYYNECLLTLVVTEFDNLRLKLYLMSVRAHTKYSLRAISTPRRLQ